MSTPPPIWDNTMRKKTEYSYGVLASAYQSSGASGKWFKISMPISKSVVRMFGMDVSMTYDYSHGYFAKLFIRVVSSANDVNIGESASNRVDILTNDPDAASKIEVHFASPCDIWIKATGPYSECSVDRIHTLDNMRYQDAKNTTVSLVGEELPTSLIYKLRPHTLTFT